MLRKFIHICISVLLLTVTAGFSVSKHYCGPRLVSVDINHEAKSCCDMDNCCHSETKTFQLEEDFTASPILQSDVVRSIEIFLLSEILMDAISISEVKRELFISESPPPKDKQTILSSLQSFLC